jgi:hypothetical protein
MNYKTGTYRTTIELITALRSFMVTDCSLTERAFAVDGTGYKLLVSDANAQYNFRTALNEKVVDVQDGNLTGLAMNFSTAYDAGKAWNLQTNYTRYLHNIPDDGYYQFDGSNDNVTIKNILTLGNKFTVAFMFNRQSVAWGYETLLDSRQNSSNAENIFYYDGYLYFRTRLLGVNAQLKSSGALPADNNWHSIVIAIDRTASAGSRGKMYLDGVDYTGTDTIGTTGLSYGSYNIGQAVNPYMLNCQIKNYIIHNDIYSITDAVNYHAINISKYGTLWYKCNEADTGAPYTDKALDSSGNGNHGTPTNITGATFFNQS